MQKLEVTLETVTPLFLGGANPRGAPELRPPAFRGAMRYWFRAMAGGIYGDDVEAVQKAESAVFGSTDKNTGGASAIVIRQIEQPDFSEMSYSQIADWNPKSNSYRRGGSAYLLFAAREIKSKSKPEPERKGLFGKFDLCLATRPGVSILEDTFKRAYISFWLLTHFGGIGSRSRRGAGSVQVIDTRGSSQNLENLPSLKIQAVTPQDLVMELKYGLEAIKQYMGTKVFRPAIQSPSSFDIIHPQVCKVWVINKTYDGWNDALNEFGKIYQDFRTKRYPDYKTVKDAMVSHKPMPQSVQRSAFGLPIPFFYRSLGNENATLESKDYDRRASPLWVRIIKLANGKYTIALVWFQSQFLPSDERLELHQRKRTISSGQLPNNDLLETFITQSDPVKKSSLKDKGLAVMEVHYD